MSTQPWGPHGPTVPDHTVTPNPTPSSPHQMLGGADYSPASAALAGGNPGAGGLFAQIIFSLILFAMLWIPMACLYPLTALAAMVAGFGSYAILLRALPPDLNSLAYVTAFGVGAAVIFVVFRIEYRLALQQVFRLARHVVRMALLAAWAIPIIQLCMGATAPSTSTRYILSAMNHPLGLAAWLAYPRNLLIWVVVVAGLHFMIWSWQGFRTWWHRRLVFIGLK
jgi:hypothetical protein